MIGQVLGHYRVVKRLGSGAWGEVYLAHDERLERDVAIKILSSGTLADEEARKSFRKEALTLARLNHPNIGGIFDFDTEDGLDFLVMEYVHGGTLSSRISASSLTEREIVLFGVQITDALQEAHEKGIIHRDLKPDNIAITSKGQLKVLDFGIAKLFDPASGPFKAETMTESVDELHLAGTVPYMAPEQVRGEHIDSRADIYALGAILYEMATHDRPFREDLSTRLIDAILHRPPVSPRAVNARISPDLERIILKCLQKSPEQRYQAAREVGVDLRGSGTASVPPAPVTVQATHSRMRLWMTIVILTASVVAAALLTINTGGWRKRWLGRTTSARIGSLAVLPLANLSNDPEQDYFADGMTEELITDLAQIGALTVISRTSVMKYKGSTKTLPEIARELNVDGIIEGSVQRSGNRVKITAQLIQGATDRHVWARSYDRDLGDILALENEVAQAIAGEIRVSITPQEQVRLARSRPVDPAAYDAYLLGFHYAWSWQKSGPETAIGYFHQAIAKDPNLAIAYVGIADSHIILVDNGFEDPLQGYAKAEEATNRALEIDPHLGDAHRTSGAVNEYRWNWIGAEREYQLSIQANPGNARAHHWYAILLSALGRPSEAVAEARRAVELDPLGLYNRAILADVFYKARQYENAANELEKTIASEPDLAPAYSFLAKTLLQTGRSAEAISECKKGEASSPDAGAFDALLSYAYARAGRKTEAVEILQRMHGTFATRYVPPTDFAWVYTGLGDKEQAFHWLETAFAQRDTHLEHIKVDPIWDPLRSDPRFTDLVRRVGLPQ